MDYDDDNDNDDKCFDKYLCEYGIFALNESWKGLFKV